MTTDSESPHPLLVTTEWLEQHLDSPNLVLIDCGAPDAYRRAHIPNAVSISHDPFLKGAENPKLVMQKGEFETLVRALGVSNNTSVIVYDDSPSMNAARAWWVFERFGHNDLRVLDGGISAWIAEGRLMTSRSTSHEPGTFTANLYESHHCRIEDVRSAIEDPNIQIWDTRSEGEWSGENSRGNERVGHIPGAIWLEWLKLLQEPPVGRFRPLDEIRQILVTAGIDPEAGTITY